MAEQIISAERFIDEQRFGRSQIAIVLLCGLVLATDGFDVQLLSYVAPMLSESLHLSKAALGPVFSAGLAGMLVGSLIGGLTADRIGRKPVILFSLIWFGLWTIATATAGTASMLILLRFIAGLGFGAAAPISSTLTSEFGPKRHRATMMMVMFCGFSLGAALGGPVTSVMLKTMSWPAIFVVAGCLPLVVAAIMAFMLPESLRYLAVRQKERSRIERAMRFVRQDFVLSPSTRVIVEEPAERVAARQLFVQGRAASTLLLWLVVTMGFMNLYFVFSWLPTIMHSNGVDIHSALLITSGFQIGGTLGAVVLGRLMDGSANPPAPVAIAFIAGAACIVLIGSAGTSVTMLAIAVFVAGGCIVSAQIAVAPLAAFLYPTAIRSTGVGWAVGIGRIGAVLGPVIGGFILSLDLSPQTVFQLAAVPAALAAAASMAMVIVARRQEKPGTTGVSEQRVSM